MNNRFYTSKNTLSSRPDVYSQQNMPSYGMDEPLHSIVAYQFSNSQYGMDTPQGSILLLNYGSSQYGRRIIPIQPENQPLAEEFADLWDKFDRKVNDLDDNTGPSINDTPRKNGRINYYTQQNNFNKAFNNSNHYDYNQSNHTPRSSWPMSLTPALQTVSSFDGNPDMLGSFCKGYTTSQMLSDVMREPTAQ